MYLASTSNIKRKAVGIVFHDWNIECVECQSLVNEQPVGRTEIRDGAFNRLRRIPHYPAVSMETGIVKHVSEHYADITCVLFKTRFGIFEAWSELVLHDSFTVHRWLELGVNRFKTTLGSIANPEKSNDWYPSSQPRSLVMARALYRACQQARAVQQSMPQRIIPATLSHFQGVNFLDLQYPLQYHSRDLSETVRRLADRLLFDTVIAMDARGFLLCGEFQHENYPVIMARKSGKLPNEGPSYRYNKEYGTDSVCISKDTLKPGARVIVVDDIVATGGTMLAVEELVKREGGTVVAFIAPYAIEVNGKLLATRLGHRLRFLCTQVEVETETPWEIDVEAPHDPVLDGEYNFLTLSPPSLESLTINTNRVRVKWGKFRHSSNIWINTEVIRNQKLYVFLDPSNYREMIDMLQILSILYRKDPTHVIVVIPFLEQSTQDRVEYDGYLESVAGVDTLSKLIGKHQILTFDLHAEQSRFAFYDLRYDSLVAKLWQRYKREHPEAIPVFPDEGASKRFGRLIQHQTPIVFRKKRQGERRIVATDSEIEPTTTKRYVVIDDLVRSGGTMRAVGEYLISKGALAVDALFAHAPLEPSACENLSIFQEVWSSDSCPRLVPPEWVKIRVISMIAID